MNVLVIGSGGREHAIAWKLSQSSRVSKIFIAPGNAGTTAHGENVPVKADDVDALRSFALKEEIGLTIVGPETALAKGIVDAFQAVGLKIFGPSKQAAEIEGSKVFCKELLLRHNIPTARYESFNEPEKALNYIKTHEPPFVIKADGLAAGKGVAICLTKDEAQRAIVEIMQTKAFGDAGSKIIIEEFLEGEEASFLAITDGKTVIPLPSAQDHKRVFDNDEGPNTGGMGAYSPAPVVTPSLEKAIMSTVMLPVVSAMEAEGRPYKGVLYAGLMIKDGRIKVLEFNCRFGDPETQPILMRLESDFFELIMACVEDRLNQITPVWSDKASVCVVMASKGYPSVDYDKGKLIYGLHKAHAIPDVMIFHAGTAFRDSRAITAGGRVLGVTSLGITIKDAIERAYQAVEKITWEGAHYRKDIGKRAL
ncbi:phosphoribosylamine--glycine ligase [bacterium]|nr:MAG: phosphoribosylamine--glycine ligase [bacterium]